MRQSPSAGGARSSDDAGRLMDAKAAQRTSVVRIPKLLSSDEVAELLEVFAAIEPRCGHVSFGGNSDNDVSQRGGRWDTCYIHTAGLFKKTAPALYSKIVEAAFTVDRSTWQVLHDDDTPGAASSPTRRADVAVRTAEIHTVSDSGGIPDANHRDLGSLVTIDVMLKQPEIDFSGGQFQTLEADGTMQQYKFERGDAVVFISHKYHCIRPVVQGLRQVCVLELWQGDERSCGHRCKRRLGPCPFMHAS